MEGHNPNKNLYANLYAYHFGHFNHVLRKSYLSPILGFLTATIRLTTNKGPELKGIASLGDCWLML